MPSWCQNILEIEGDEEDLTNFIEKAEDGKFRIKWYFPMPEELEGTTSPSTKPNHELIAKYGCDNWYDWCCWNWGVKWDVNYNENQFFMVKEKGGPTPVTTSNEMEIDGGKVAMSYLTPYGPPVRALLEISKRNPTLMFTTMYADMGHGRAGTVRITNGFPISIENGDPEEYVERYDFAEAY